MQIATLAQMGVTAVLAATLPLSMVWMSADANKYRKLVWLGVFLTFDLIVFGAFTRLSDSGLGCPDWPGCYGLANPILALDAISRAQALMPSGPVTLQKAWIEMTHRYLAMAIAVLIVTIMAQAWRQWGQSRRAEFSPWLPTALFFFICLQGAFGAWTVTMKLQPAIVTIHLLLGMCLLAALAWLGGRQDNAVTPLTEPGCTVPAMRRMRLLAALATLLLLVQIALGGWVSSNYATLACSDFPLCDGKLVPAMDFGQGFTFWRALGKTASGHYLPFPALTAIHWMHRSFALVLFAGIGYTAYRARVHPGLRLIGGRIALVLLLQAGTGIATISLNYPLPMAVLHNAGAALLVLLLTMLNCRAKFHFEFAQRRSTSGLSRPSSPARHQP
jgi:cytochrome c oxidase assembly protein subunit 15